MAVSASVTTHVRPDGLGEISFSHPKANSLSSDLLRDLAAGVTALSNDPRVAVILLRSAGEGTFCGGASFEEFQKIQTETEGHEFFLGFARVILAIRAATKLVVCRVQGKAVGGGVGVVAASDYAFATSGASARLSELELGIGPFTIGPAVERKLGLSAFGAMSIDCAFRDAEWLHARGLYHALGADLAELDAKLEAFLAKLLAVSPPAAAELKRALWEGTEHWPALLDARAQTSGRLLVQHRQKNPAPSGGR